MATDQASGMSTPEPFAYFDPDSCSWRMCQGSLLEDSGESCTTWPRQVTWDRQFAWELPTSVHLIDASESSSSLLPTPDGSLFNDGQSVEAYQARKERELEKGYNGNGGGTTLAMMVRLLPTPSASDHTGAEGETRVARQEAGATGGPSLRDLGHLLPTPMSNDWKGGMAAQHQLSDAARSLLPTPTARDGKGSGQHPEKHMAAHRLTGIEHRDDPTRPPLLPTPAAADGDGGRLDSEETFRSGRRPSGSKATRTLRSTLHHNLLPTPVANPDNPGAGGELRAAIEHGPSRRNETGIDSMGRPNRGRALLPTPTSQDARQNALNEAEAQRNPATMWATMGRVQSGDHTSPRFGGGRQSSPETHPDQLTLGDA